MARNKKAVEDKAAKQKATATKRQARKRRRIKRVRLIEGDKLLACKKYSASIPYSRVATDFAEQYSNKAYDFKLVAKDDVQNWFFVIAADKKYEIAQEELVVPTDYALLWVVAQEGNNALVIIPHIDSTVIGATKDGEVIYVQTARVNVYAENLDGLSVAVDTALSELRESKIVVGVAYIVNPPEEIPLRVINMFKAFDLSAEVVVLDPALYQGDLTLNVTHAFRKKQTFTNFFAAMQQNRRKVLLTVLSLLSAFLWAYLPAHGVLSLAKNITLNTSAQITSDITQIQNSKQMFNETLQGLSNKLTTLSSYKEAYDKLPSVNWAPVVEVIMSDPHVTSFRISGNQANITYEGATSKQLDQYVNKLLTSGYFSAVPPYTRTLKPSTYSITVEVKLP